MFPVSNNDIQPISPSNQEMPFFDEDSSFLFHFPSSPMFSHHENNMDMGFLSQFDDHNLVYHQRQSLDKITVAETAASNIEGHQREIRQEINKEIDTASPIDEKQILKKKLSKKGRNSKINTAQGPRDRRMRLSLVVARKFFALQDMLGFDKASRTVEWLLVQAKDEIKKVARGFSGANNASSTSECEVVSGIDENTINEIQVLDKECDVPKERETCLKKVRKKEVMKPRKNASKPLGKESREKARERARERTIAKMRNRGLNEVRICDEVEANLGSSGAVEAAGEEPRAQSHSMNPSFEELLAEAEEGPRSGDQHDEVLNMGDKIDDSMMIIDRGSPSSLLVNLQNTGTSQEHLFTELQFSGKPWEIYDYRDIF